MSCACVFLPVSCRWHPVLLSMPVSSVLPFLLHTRVLAICRCFRLPLPLLDVASQLANSLAGFAHVSSIYVSVLHVWIARHHLFARTLCVSSPLLNHASVCIKDIRFCVCQYMSLTSSFNCLLFDACCVAISLLTKALQSNGVTIHSRVPIVLCCSFSSLPQFSIDTLLIRSSYGIVAAVDVGFALCTLLSLSSVPAFSFPFSSS